MEIVLALAAWLKQEGGVIPLAPFTFSVAAIAIFYFTRKFYLGKIKEREKKHAAYKADQKALVDGILLNKDSALEVERNRNEFLLYQVAQLKEQFISVRHQKPTLYPAPGMPLPTATPSLAQKPKVHVERLETLNRPIVSPASQKPVFSKVDAPDRTTELGLITFYTLPADLQHTAEQLAAKPAVL